MARTWRRGGGALLLAGLLLGVLAGCGHNPNHDVDMEEARKAANRVKPPPPPGAKMEPGHGG